MSVASRAWCTRPSCCGVCSPRVQRGWCECPADECAYALRCDSDAHAVAVVCTRRDSISVCTSLCVTTAVCLCFVWACVMLDAACVLAGGDMMCGACVCGACDVARRYGNRVRMLGRRMLRTQQIVSVARRGSVCVCLHV